MTLPIEVHSYGPRTDHPPVVVLHGGPGAPGSVRELAEMLADDRPVLEPLQRRSGAVPLTVAQHVADLAGVLRAPADLIGHSWGAMLGLSFATEHPARVRTLALIGCGTYDEDTRREYDRRRELAVFDAAVPAATNELDDPVGRDETWADVLRLQREGIEPRRFRAVRAPVLMLHGADDPHPGLATFELLRRVVPTIEYEGARRVRTRTLA